VNSGTITGLTTLGGGEGIDFAGNTTSSVTVTNNATGLIAGDANGINAAIAMERYRRRPPAAAARASMPIRSF
jgi:hypothetical protein